MASAKYKGFFWPGLLGFRHMPKFKEQDFYTDDGNFRRTTADDKMAFYMQHPVWEGHPELFNKNASLKHLYATEGMTLERVCNLFGNASQAPVVADSFNYIVEKKAEGKVTFVSGIYSEDEIREDPARAVTRGILFRGEPGKPMALLVSGGGFVGVGNFMESIPVAVELNRQGYSAFCLVYRVNDELHGESQESRGADAVLDAHACVRWLVSHQSEYGYTMDGFGMFGFSAGGLITTAYSFYDYTTCCLRHGLPRPAAVFPIYGLHWTLKVRDEDKGLALFSRVGRDDDTGFMNIEDHIPEIRAKIGEENFDMKIIDHLGHGFGIGAGTPAEGWLAEAVGFWEMHRDTQK